MAFDYNARPELGGLDYEVGGKPAEYEINPQALSRNTRHYFRIDAQNTYKTDYN